MQNNLIKYADGSWGVRFRLPTHYHKSEFKRKIGTKTEALRFRDEVRLKIRRREPLETKLPRGHQLAEVIKKWAAIEGRNHQSYQVAGRFLKWAGSLRLEDVTPDTLRRLLDSLKKKYAPNTVLSYWGVMKSIFSYAERDLELIAHDKNPFRKKYNLPSAVQRTSDLDRAQIMRLLSECDQPLKDMVKFAVLTGLRQGETLSLRWEMVDFEERYLLLPKTKNGKPHKLPLSSEVVEILQGQRGNGSPFCFCSQNGKKWNRVTFYKLWRITFNDVGLEDYCWHDLRHTLASVAVSTGSTLFLVSSLLNHSDPAMSKRYARANQEAKRDALERVSVYFSCTDEKSQ